MENVKEIFGNLLKASLAGPVLYHWPFLNKYYAQDTATDSHTKISTAQTSF